MFARFSQNVWIKSVVFFLVNCPCFTMRWPPQQFSTRISTFWKNGFSNDWEGDRPPPCSPYLRLWLACIIWYMHIAYSCFALWFLQGYLLFHGERETVYMKLIKVYLKKTSQNLPWFLLTFEPLIFIISVQPPLAQSPIDVISQNTFVEFNLESDRIR